MFGKFGMFACGAILSVVSFRALLSHHVERLVRRNHSFKHFVYFVKEFDLIEDSECLPQHTSAYEGLEV